MEKEFNDLHRDMLSEICNLSMSEATFVTSQLRGKGQEAEFNLPDIEVLDKKDFIQGAELDYKTGLIVAQSFSGDLKGELFMCFSELTEKKIAKLYLETNKPIEEIDRIEVSTIAEIGNIFMNSFIVYLRRFLGESIHSDLPRVLFWENYSELFSREIEDILLVRTIFNADGISIEGKFGIGMSKDNFQNLLAKLNKILGVL